MGNTIKRLGYAFSAAVLAFGAVAVPGSMNAYADGESYCSVTGGAININGGELLCVMNEAVSTINFSGTVSQLGDMLFALGHNAGYGYGDYARSATIKATVSDIFSNEQVVWLATLMPDYDETVELIPASGDYVVTDLDASLPARYEINYGNVVVHLPNSATAADALSMYRTINNQTAVVAAGTTTVSHSDTYGTVVHLPNGTSLADGLTKANEIGASGDYVVSSGMDYWLDVENGSTDVYVLSAAALNEALGLDAVSTIYVNYDIAVDKITVPEGKTVIEDSASLTINNLAESSIEGEFVRQNNESYQIVEVEETDGVTVTLSTAAGVLTAPALVQVGTDVTVNVEGEGSLDLVILSDGRVLYSGESFTVQNEDVSLKAFKFDVKVAPSEDDEIEDADEAAAVAEYVAGQIKDLLTSGMSYNGKVGLLNPNGMMQKLANGETLRTGLYTQMMDVEYWDEYLEYSEGVTKAMNDNEKVAAIYGAWLEIFSGETLSSWEGSVYELDAPVTMRLEIPEEYREAPLGYTRNFHVLRVHIGENGEEIVERIEPTRDGNYLVFENDKFSELVIVYEDVLNPVASPETGVFTTSKNGSNSVAVTPTEAMLTTMVAVVAVVALAGAVKLAKTRK